MHSISYFLSLSHTLYMYCIRLMRGRFHHERQCIDALGASGNPSAKTGGFSHGRKRLCVITWAHLSVCVCMCVGVCRLCVRVCVLRYNDNDDDGNHCSDRVVFRGSTAVYCYTSLCEDR